MVQLRKGQIEMMGLLIIVVVLIAIVILFFSLNIGNTGPESNKFLTIKANNLMNALDKVSLSEGSGGELIVACCEGGPNALECGKLTGYFEDLVGSRAKSGLDIRESASLFVENRRIAGSCVEGVNSQTEFYPTTEGCSARVIICEL